MEPLKKKSDTELLGMEKIGVHTAAEMIRRGIAKRCAKGEADWIVRRSGVYSSYGIKAMVGISGRWMQYADAEPYTGETGNLTHEDSIVQANHDGGPGVVVAPDGTRIYWED